MIFRQNFIKKNLKNIINFALFTIYKKSDKIIENEKLDFYKISNSIFSNF